MVYQKDKLEHNIARHGDPMDMISWKDELETFGPNSEAACTSAASTSTDLSMSTRNTSDEMKDADIRVPLPQATRAGELVHVDIHQEDLASVEQLISRHNLQVQAIEFKTQTGGGGWINHKNLPLQDLIREVETVYGIQVSAISRITTTIPSTEITGVKDDPAVLNVEIIK